MGHNTDYSSLPRTSLIPRTSGYEHSINTDESDEFEEDVHDDYPVSNFIDKLVDQFQIRPNIQSIKYFSPQFLTDEATQIPEQANSSIEKAMIHLLDIPALTSAKRSTYIHSWCDISKVTSIEAKRVISHFFVNQYKCIDKKSWQLKAEITWAKSYTPRSFVKTPQANKISHPVRIFHYVGLGFPPPESNRIWMKDTAFSHGGYSHLSEIKPTLSSPCLLIFDCDKAAILRDYLIAQNSNIYDPSDIFFAFFACSQTEQLRIASTLPQNFFSCVILSPDRAFTAITKIQIPDPNIFDTLLDIFTETIALDSLPTDVFYRLFRGFSTISTLWKRFLLAQRLMHTFGLHSQSIPDLVDMSEHQLWNQFEYALMSIGAPVIGNPIISLSDLYIKNFESVDKPPHYVCAFVTSLLQIPELHTEIMGKIADFMEKSPQNCRIIGKVINFRSLGELNAVARKKSEEFCHWCTIMSGLLLALPSLVKTITSSLNTSDLIKICSEKTLSSTIQTSSNTKAVGAYKLIQSFSPNTTTFASNSPLRSQNSLSYISSNLLTNSSTNSSSNSKNSSNAQSTNRPKNSILTSKTIPSDYSNNSLSSLCPPEEVYYDISDKTKVLLFSILVTTRDIQTHFNCYYNTNNTTCRFLPLLFKSSPILREWIVLFIHSEFARFTPEPHAIGKSGIHAYCMLLLSEKRKITRTAAVTILSTILTNHCPDFNETIMRCALKAAIDGSSIVRFAFLCCAARYTCMNKDKLYDTSEYEIEDLIMEDPLKFTEKKVRITLRKLIEHLQNDPSDEIRRFADQLIADPVKSGLNDAYQENGREIHKLAHSLLFSNNCDKSKMEQRYVDPFFSIDELEHFETIDTTHEPKCDLHNFSFNYQSPVNMNNNTRNSMDNNVNIPGDGNLVENCSDGNSSVVAVCFDFDHKNVCIATENGLVVWGENRWQVSQDPIHAIAPLPHLIWAVASGNGSIYLFRNGFEDPIDAFQPSTIRPSGKSVLATIENSMILYVSQGNHEILVWDIESLLLIHRIKVPSPPTAMQIIENKLYALLKNGSVLEIDRDTNKITKENKNMYENETNHSLKIGVHKNTLYSASEIGPLYFWEDFEYPRQITDDWPKSIDFLVHSEFPLAIKICEHVTLLQLYQDAPIELQTNNEHKGTCCCFDRKRPLAAIGYDDGTVSIWRVPIPKEE